MGTRSLSFPVVLAFLVLLRNPGSSQAALSVSLSGGIKILDQDGRSGFQPDGAGYDVLTIRGTNEAGTYGFSLTDENLLSRMTYVKSVTGVDDDSDGTIDRIVTTTGSTHGLDIRDWNVWYRLREGRARVSAGLVRNADYRTTLPNWYVSTFGGTDLVFGQGLLVQAYPAPGLSLGLFLPVSLAGQDFLSDTLGGADLSASWSIRNLGMVKVLLRTGQAYSVDLNGDGDTGDAGETVSDACMANAGFLLTARDGLLASVLGRVLWSSDARAVFLYAATGFDYDVTPKWAVRGEFGWARKPEFSGVKDAPSLGTFWDAWARVRYRVTDRLYSHLSLSVDEEGAASVRGTLGYSFGDGLAVSTHLGWKDGLLWDLYVYYEVSL